MKKMTSYYYCIIIYRYEMLISSMMFLIFSCNLDRVAACTLWFFWIVFLSVCVCLRPLMFIQACFNLISSFGRSFHTVPGLKAIGNQLEKPNGTSQHCQYLRRWWVMAGADLKKRSASNLWPNQLEAGTADGILKVNSWRNKCF